MDSAAAEGHEKPWVIQTARAGEDKRADGRWDGNFTVTDLDILDLSIV